MPKPEPHFVYFRADAFPNLNPIFCLMQEPPDHDDFPEEHKLPIDGVLDLHLFRPKDVKELVPDYIEACLEAGIFQLRIIHGKGTGTLRRLVHSILERHPAVKAYYPGTGTGNWGATSADLIPPEATRKDGENPSRI